MCKREIPPMLLRDRIEFDQYPFYSFGGGFKNMGVYQQNVWVFALYGVTIRQ